MNRLGRVLLLTSLAATGCVRVPAKFCLTPVYDAPAGFSETYHAAVMRQEAICPGGSIGFVGPGIVVGPAISWPGAGTDIEPPLEW